MKFYFKYFFAFVVAVYLVNNIGLPVYYHYCGGELESVNALFKTDNCCGGEEDEDSDCCQNETKIISQKSESPLPSLQFKMVAPVIDLNYLPSLYNFKFEHFSSESFLNFKELNFHPPRSGRIILSSKSALII